MTVPGWPEFAFWIASIDSVRIVLIASWSCAASGWVWVMRGPPVLA